MGQVPKKSTCRVTTWKGCDQALVRRGSLTVRVGQQAIDARHHRGPPRRGARSTYSGRAIRCPLTPRSVPHPPLRAARGMARAIFEMMALPPEVPRYRALGRRAATARGDRPRHAEGPARPVIDGTGMKVDGQGEWRARRHGHSRRRAWRELPLAIDRGSHEILGAMGAEPGATDAEATGPPPGQVARRVVGVGADRADDREDGHRAVARRGAAPVIPPRGDARIEIPGDTKGDPHRRDPAPRAIRRRGREGWRREGGDHRRSLAATAMGRIKGIFGGAPRSRGWLRQGTGSGICGRALKMMTHPGMPVGVKLA